MSDYDDDEDEHDEDDKEEDEGDHEYKCQNEGCVRGTRLFWAAPPEWFDENDLKAPKNCPDCRQWKKEQEEEGDITASCQLCDRSITITPEQRITHNKEYGNWDTYWLDHADSQICWQCEQIPGRSQKLVYKQVERKYREEREGKSPDLITKQEFEKEAKQKLLNVEKFASKLRLYLEENDLSGNPSGYDVPISLEFYRNVLVSKDDEENRLEHIVSCKHEWEERFGSENPETVLHVARDVAASTEGHVLQFRNGHKVLKYDTNNGIFVVLRQERRSPTGFMLVTAFPTDADYVLYGLTEEEPPWSCD